MSNHMAKVTEMCWFVKFLTGPLMLMKILYLHPASNVLQIRDRCLSCGVQEIVMHILTKFPTV